MQSYEIGPALGWDAMPWIFRKRVFRRPNRILPKPRHVAILITRGK